MRRYVSLAGAVLAGIGLLVACSDDDTTNPPVTGGGKDASTDAFVATDTGGNTTVDSSKPDTSTGTDASPQLDATPDTSTGDSSVEAPIVTTVGTTARISIFNDIITADFRQDDSIMRSTDFPQCVAHVWSNGKPFSSGGTIKLGGEVVGKDGGPAAELTIQPEQSSDGFSYLYFGDPPFPPDDSFTVAIESDGVQNRVPAMPVQTLRPPRAGSIAITKPTEPPAQQLIPIPANQDFEITWTVPSGNVADQQIIVGLKNFGGSNNKQASVYCRFPLASASGKIPSRLLLAVKTAIGGQSAGGTLGIRAGAQKDVNVGSSTSYIIEATRIDSTNLAASEPIIELQ